MDSRTKRTRERIVSAFFELQAEKPRERIVVRALCERAGINKSTFYKYYGSIYDLSEQIEADIVADALSTLPDPAQVFQNPSVCLDFLLRLQPMQTANLRRCSDAQRLRLIDRIHHAIKERLFETYPAYRDDFTINFYITYAVYGGFYAFFENQDYGEAERGSALKRITTYLCSGVPQFWPETDDSLHKKKNIY